MKKIVIAPNSFKDCVRSQEVADCIENGLKKAIKGVEIEKIPLADGGDGTLQVINSLKGGRIYTKQVTGPLWFPVDGEYGILPDGTGVIELAKVAGLSLLPEELRSPVHTTTYGVGELIKAVIDNGAIRVILGVGGSSTCDGGAGILSTLGVKFLDEHGNYFTPVGGTLRKIKEVGGICELEIGEIIVLSDVSNPLLGSNGAAMVYARQKGASQSEIEELELELAHFSGLVDPQLKLGKKQGMGASGGVPFGLSLIGAKVVSGAKFVMELVDFEGRAKDADLIITGEGEINELTRYGKVVWEVMQFGKARRIPVLGITGSIGKGVEKLYNQGLTSVFSLAPGPVSRGYSISRASELLEDVAERIGRILNPDNALSPRFFA